MEKKNDSFPNLSMADAAKMANSPAGKQLLAYLQSTQGNQLQSAMDQAASGNYAQLLKTMRSLMASQEAQTLLQQLKEDPNGRNGK